MKEFMGWTPLLVAAVTVIVNLAVSLATVGRHEGLIETLRNRLSELEGDVKVLKDRDGR